jgi:hypothetical protein
VLHLKSFSFLSGGTVLQAELLNNMNYLEKEKKKDFSLSPYSSNGAS